MTTYIAFLRGINVGGHHKIKMSDLVKLLKKNGFQNVTTYIQSGNVIFTSEEKKPQILEEEISKLIDENFEYTIKTFVITKAGLNQILHTNPFIKEDQNVDISKLHVSILDVFPTKDEIHQLNLLSVNFKDYFIIIDNLVYLYCQNGFGKTKLTNTFFEKKLNCRSTTRNWKTITKLIEISH